MTKDEARKAIEEPLCYGLVVLSAKVKPKVGSEAARLLDDYAAACVAKAQEPLGMLERLAQMGDGVWFFFANGASKLEVERLPGKFRYRYSANEDSERKITREEVAVLLKGDEHDA